MKVVSAAVIGLGAVLWSFAFGPGFVPLGSGARAAEPVQVPAASSGRRPDCSFTPIVFRAVVSSGPDTGLEVKGSLHIDIDATGDVTGVLDMDDETHVPVVGQAIGRSLTILLNFGGGRRISGVGTADSAISECNFRELLGPMVGPEITDFGALRLNPVPRVGG